MGLRNKIGEKLFGGVVDGITREILSFTKPGDSIIDVGAGTCLFAKTLGENGRVVTPVDIKNRSYYSNIAPEIYDGKRLPFRDGAFDAGILISVLHHTENPELVLSEAARVSNKLIVHEDLITNIFQKFYTYVLDRILNKELTAPHTNKTDEGWKDLFYKLDLRLARVKYRTTLLFLYNAIYFLEKI